MSKRAWLSLITLYNYNNELFDNMVLPPEIDKETLVNNLLMELGEFEVLYSDYEFMKFAITEWSKKRLHTWTKLSNIMFDDYDPFINIKRDEVRTIETDRNLTNKTIGKNATNTNAWDDHSDDGVQRSVSKDDITSNDTGTTKTVETFHLEGDSAITDVQDVARKEFEMRLQYDMMNYIISDFKNRFCLMIY